MGPFNEGSIRFIIRFDQSGKGENHTNCQNPLQNAPWLATGVHCWK